MRKGIWICGLALALAACHASPPASRLTINAMSPQLAGAATLAHDGGIVFAQSLGGIASAAKRQQAAQITSLVGALLRADRTLRDADLLASGTAAPLAYALFDTGTPDSPDPSTQPGAGDGSSPSPGETPQAVASSESPTAAKADDLEAQTAEAAWQQLSPGVRQQVQAGLDTEQARLLGKLQSVLAQKALRFVRVGAQTARPGLNGGHDLTTIYAIDDAQGKRSIQVVRRLDASGRLIQSVATLHGVAQGLSLDGQSTRTIQASGQVDELSSFQIGLAGPSVPVHWDRIVASDGSVSGQGLLGLPDGSSVPLSVSGQQTGVLVITAADAASGLQIALSADAAASQSSVTIQAGADGSASLSLSANDDP